MKKRIKKTFALFGITVMILSSSMTALAASCLDVRDYGRHRYNNRFVCRKELNAVQQRYLGDGKFLVRVYYEDYGFCVCGQYGKSEISQNWYEKVVSIY